MKKIIIGLFLVFSVVIFSGCGQKGADFKKEDGVKQGVVEKEEAKVGGIMDVCNYFPKELVEKALGKIIPKIEPVDVGDPSCYYYTEYKENYGNSYSGVKKPGGPKVVVVYDTKDFLKDKASNENSGSKYASDPSIGMDNFVVRNNVGKIWLVALSLGNDKFIRFKAFDDAVTGEELVKIAKEFAEKIGSGG
jgi:hypothetical protein